VPRIVVAYVKAVDAVNAVLGRFVMYGVFFFMLGILAWSSFSRAVLDAPINWAVEMAQFSLAAYYLLGGGYSLQQDAHVRMDLIYARWSPRRMAFADSLTAFFLVSYLSVLLLGGISSTEYAITFSQKNYSAWGPPLAPIKIIMCIGIVLMLLQAIALFFRDLARVMNRPIV
jgi:TRAP-type mannitol/chloroaromatic compound transport system permease small subunit